MTTLRIRIEGDQFVVTCPHIPQDGVECAAREEHVAVSDMISWIRSYFRRQPVDWIEEPEIEPDADARDISVTGLWPLTYTNRSEYHGTD